MYYVFVNSESACYKNQRGLLLGYPKRRKIRGKYVTTDEFAFAAAFKTFKLANNATEGLGIIFERKDL